MSKFKGWTLYSRRITIYEKRIYKHIVFFIFFWFKNVLYKFFWKTLKAQRKIKITLNLSTHGKYHISGYKTNYEFVVREV